MDFFSRSTRSWFAASFPSPTEVQRRGWEPIARGSHALLVAPTGSGKTLAAFLWGIDSLARLPPEAPPGVRVLYVSPLKALVYDVERNLRAPLVGIGREADRTGAAFREIRLDVRTGDTPARERRLQARDPGEILVTTPESLFLLLGSGARETLRTVHTVIVDEIHALVPTKRGTHLALSLERLAALTSAEPQRIGLSATVRPLDEVARFLGGTRPVEVVDASAPPSLDLRIAVPVPDMERVRAPEATAKERRGGSILGELAEREVRPKPPERGIWSALYPAILEEIRANRSTIVFVNSRGLCERLSQRLNDLAGEELVRAHHGSVSREKRIEIEEGLKAGAIRGIVATSSLELGIDMGAVDLVILVESPGSVARGLQRVGRAGHQVGAVSVGRIYPKFRGDLLECAVVARRMLRGEIEALRAPRSPLDVLAQQIVAMCCDRPRTVEEIERIVRRASSYRDLPRAALESVLDMLSGRYPSTDFAELRPLLAWDRSEDILTARRGAALVSRMNAGTIPDRGNYGVFLGPGGPRVGELDEEMVFETRAGENILLGASTWRVEEITRDRVIVTPAPGEPGRLPFWHGDGPGRPVELGRAVGAFVRELSALRPEDAARHLRATTPIDSWAAENLAAYVFDQREHTGTVPTDRAVTVERFRDELGDWRVCILTPFGARIHAPWAMALQQSLADRSGFEVQVMYTDDGIVLRFADVEDLPEADALIPDPDTVEDLLVAQLGRTALFAGLFRENAARALLIPRRRPDRRSPLWAQRLKAQNLLAAVQRYPSFPVVIETYRHALSDVFDLPGLVDLLRRIRSREIRVVDVETRSASPFARSLVFAYVAEYIYDQDAPLAERKAQALTLDRSLLTELLGQAELRELIDAAVVGQVEAELQHLAEDRRARDADALHDLLRRAGDLSLEEMRERSSGDPRPWLERLARERRAAEIGVAGERRWIAAEDAAVYRDALGCVPPAGLPAGFLEPAVEPLEQLFRRYARTHGPFVTKAPAERFGLLPAQAEQILRALAGSGALVRGEIRPGGAELDWCDAEVLRRLKRQTLAKLRHEVAPAEARMLGVFLPAWQGVRGGSPGGDRLEEAVAQLEGLPLPWSELAGVILPERVPEFRAEALDMLCAVGRIAWVGRGPLGPRDGRVALYRRDRAAQLLSLPVPLEHPSALHMAILARLETRGASFLVEIEAAVKRAHPETPAEELQAALWDLVWAGQITNDTFSPLRSLGRAHRTVRGRRRSGHALAGGRWSLVRGLLDPSITETERALARANMLLDRYGILSREAAAAEEVPGGFGPVYRALRAMEEAGRVRRGYFVEGLSAAQFGRPGAVDLLRALRADEASPAGPEEPIALAALDPANPYGVLLPWPETRGPEPQRPRRMPGAWAVLVSGRPALYLAPGTRQLLTFEGVDEPAMELACRALHHLPRGRPRRLLAVEKVDGVPVRDSPHYELLRRCGFESDYRGLIAAPLRP